jgi:hypothetical protein
MDHPPDPRDPNGGVAAPSVAVSEADGNVAVSAGPLESDATSEDNATTPMASTIPLPDLLPPIAPVATSLEVPRESREATARPATPKQPTNSSVPTDEAEPRLVLDQCALVLPRLWPAPT